MGKLLCIKINKEVKSLYDIEVKDNHNFIVNNGIVVHNSEQYLSRESLCVLASLNCGRFDKINYEEDLKKCAYSINRFLDNVNQKELDDCTYATPHQKLAIENLRRTGAGLTNMAAWLFKHNTEYGSDIGNTLLHKFNERYNYYLYESSIKLGAEKGNFGLFDKNKFTQSPFIKHMMDLGLIFDSMRNVTCSSIAPTGTLSLMFRDFVMSYGVEPAFGLYFWKRTRISGKYEYYFCVPNVVRQFFALSGYEIPIQSDTIRDTWDGKYGMPVAAFIDKHKELMGLKFKSSTEILVQDKLNLMANLMKDVDSSISVTYTLPEKSTWEDTYNLIVGAHSKGVKSIAAFPDRKMYGIVSFIPFYELANKLITDGVVIHDSNFSESEKTRLSLNKADNNMFGNVNAPKRNRSLSCDVHHVSVKGERFIVLVGLQEGRPFEVFGGSHQKFNISKTIKTGTIIKNGSRDYRFEGGECDECNFGNLSTVADNTHYSDMTRMVSLALRHGANVKFVVEQLNKNESIEMFGFTKVLARVLKTYIPHGEKASGKCPECGGEKIYENGCSVCVGCGVSKC